MLMNCRVSPPTVRVPIINKKTLSSSGPAKITGLELNVIYINKNSRKSKHKDWPQGTASSIIKNRKKINFLTFHNFTF